MAFNCYVIYMHCCNAIQLQSAGNAANKRDEIETANGHANRDEWVTKPGQADSDPDQP